MVIPITFAMAILLAFAAGVYVIRSHRRYQEELEALADELGLHYEGGATFEVNAHGLHGSHEGREYSVDSQERRSSSTGHNKRKNDVIYRISVGGEVPSDLEIRHKRLERRDKSIKLGEVLEVGRPELDGPYVFRCEHEERARAILDDDTVAEALVTLADNQPLPRMVDRSLSVEHREMSWQANGVRERFEQMVRCAEALEERAGELEAKSVSGVPQW